MRPNAAILFFLTDSNLKQPPIRLWHSLLIVSLLHMTAIAVIVLLLEAPLFLTLVIYVLIDVMWWFLLHSLENITKIVERSKSQSRKGFLSFFKRQLECFVRPISGTIQYTSSTFFCQWDAGLQNVGLSYLVQLHLISTKLFWTTILIF